MQCFRFVNHLQNICKCRYTCKLLQTVVETLSAMEPQLSQLEDESRQIRIEAGQAEAAHLQQQVIHCTSISNNSR